MLDYPLRPSPVVELIDGNPGCKIRQHNHLAVLVVCLKDN